MTSTLAQLVRRPAVAALATPAVILDEEAVRHNIAEVIALVGDPANWRAHVKTARTQWTIRQLLASGVGRFKAATVAELALVLEAGAADVLLAFPAVGPTRDAAAALATRYPNARVSVLVDNVTATRAWPASLAAFLDIDTGMHRTGIESRDRPTAVQVAAAVAEQGGAVIGVHAYDGHLADAAPADRRAEVAAALADLHALAGELEAAGHRIEELAVAGSHTFMDVPAGRGGGAARVTVGVGTAVYNDSRSLQRYEREPVPPRFVPAGGVLTRVVSRRPGQVTVDAGLTAVQVDAGRPHAEVVGRPDVVAAGVSQEHLVLTGDVVDLQVGDLLVLLPRHLDTAIAQFEVVHRVGGDGSVTRDRVVGRDYSSS